MKPGGLGYNIGILFGTGNRPDLFKAALGKTITALKFDCEINPDGSLMFGFADGTGIRIHDDARSCCEHRYMTCDDLNSLFYHGAVLMGIDVKEGPTVERDGEPHEQMLLEVRTSKGTFTVTMHNEHNGYYGGILPVVKVWIPS